MTESPTLGDRALRVALTGVVPEDDPHVIADMQWELERRGKEIASLRAVLKECADDLETAIRQDYSHAELAVYPDLKRKYERDMKPVNTARALLGGEQQAPITTEVLDQAQFGKVLHKRPSREQKVRP
jgi:hypothetical protein